MVGNTITRANAVIRGSDEVEWLRRCDTLTAVRTDERNGTGHTDSYASATRLVALARALVAGQPRVDLGCALGTAPEAHRACELAAELDARGPAGAPADIPADQVASAYLTALQGAAPAVYVCRRVEHASGRCLFDAAGPQRDLCGHLLLVAHALRGGIPGSAAG